MTDLFLTVLEISVSVSPVILLLLLLSPLLNRRYAAKWNYLIWIFLAVRMLIPFSGADSRSAADMVSYLHYRRRVMKNGFSVLVCVVALTVSMGTLVGCGKRECRGIIE